MKKILLVISIFLLTACSETPVKDDTELKDDVLQDETFEYESLYEQDVYQWIVTNQLDNGLVKTTIASDTISLYDNALAGIVFTIYEDYEKAEAIFDFFESRMDTELNDEYGGFAQFRKPNGEMNDGPIGRRWIGDNAWLLISLNYYHQETNSTTYQNLADGLENYIRGLQREDGGLNSGYDPYGEMMPPVTEGMIDSYNAVLEFDMFHENVLDYLEETRYDETYNVYQAWPGNSDYEYALDVSTYSYLGMEQTDINVLEFANNRFLLTYDGVVGYCADDDLDAVFIEYGFQMATAYIKAKDYAQATGIITQMEKTIINGEGFPYTTNAATGYGNNMLWATAHTDIHLSSNAWYLFAINGINPMKPGVLSKVVTLDAN